MGKGTLGGKSAETSSESSAATGRISEVGLSGAPPEAERIRDQETASSQAHETTSSRAHEPVSSRAQEERPVQYTLRMSYDESDQLDTVARALRKRRGRSTASSDVLRGLVALAKEDPELQQRLARELESS